MICCLDSNGNRIIKPDGVNQTIIGFLLFEICDDIQLMEEIIFHIHRAENHSTSIFEEIGNMYKIVVNSDGIYIENTYSKENISLQLADGLDLFSTYLTFLKS